MKVEGNMRHGQDEKTFQDGVEVDLIIFDQNGLDAPFGVHISAYDGTTITAWVKLSDLLAMIGETVKIAENT